MALVAESRPDIGETQHGQFARGAGEPPVGLLDRARGNDEKHALALGQARRQLVQLDVGLENLGDRVLDRLGFFVGQRAKLSRIKL